MYRIITLTGCLAGILSYPAPAADGPTARDRYFDAARNNNSEWVGVRTSILLRRGAKENASIREVGESADFRSGDQFRFRLQANDDGYAYLLLQAPNGSYKLLYPTTDMKPRANQVRAFEDRLLPVRSKEWMAFDNKPAIEGLYLVFSPKPVGELERALGASATLSKSEFDNLMTENGRTVSMTFDEPEDEEAGLIPATFYVEKRSEGRRFLVRKIDLVHRDAPRRKDGDR
jgi:hypothetical protein